MIILASASAARKRMLDMAGILHEVSPSTIDEQAVKRSLSRLLPDDVAVHLAEAKAIDVSAKHPGDIVLGADQTLVCHGRLFDKPKSLEEAKSQLLDLKGHWHRLISAVVLARNGKPIWRHAETARLHMRDFSAAFLSSYLEREKDFVLHSVGAYRIEGAGVHLFDEVEGDSFTIQGLPLLALLKRLREMKEIEA